MASKYAIPMKRTAWELVPAGNYTLELTDVRDGPVFQNKRGEDEATIKLILAVVQGPKKGMEVSTLINPMATGLKSNSRRWGEALSGHDFDDDEVFDVEAYIGQQVWAKVDVVPDGQGVERNKITVVMPVGGVEVQTAGAGPTAASVAPPAAAGSGAARRPAPAATGRPRLAQGLEAPPDRELDLPEEAWDQLEPPPPDDDGSAR